MKILWSLLLLAVLSDLRPSWDSLVEAEKSFARTSVAKGTKEAFLGVLADDSVIFRPNAVPGRNWFQDNPAATIQLNWSPEFADIAIAGDLGYTTGPWEVRRTAPEEPVAFGHYVTLWRKQSNGEWKVVIDNGISHDRSAKPAKVDSPLLPKQVGGIKSKPELATATTALLRADRAATGSLADYLADDVRLYRDGSFPFVGKAAALQQVSKAAGSMADQHSFISTSADLGCTYGSINGANFVRIWKKQRDGSWKIVIDLMTPAPKQ